MHPIKTLCGSCASAFGIALFPQEAFADSWIIDFLIPSSSLPPTATESAPQNPTWSSAWHRFPSCIFSFVNHPLADPLRIFPSTHRRSIAPRACGVCLHLPAIPFSTPAMATAEPPPGRCPAPPAAAPRPLGLRIGRAAEELEWSGASAPLRPGLGGVCDAGSSYGCGRHACSPEAFCIRQ